MALHNTNGTLFILHATVTTRKTVAKTMAQPKLLSLCEANLQSIGLYNGCLEDGDQVSNHLHIFKVTLMCQDGIKTAKRWNNSTICLISVGE